MLALFVAIALLAAPNRSTSAPKPAWKTIDLVSATCGSVAPGPLTFGIPADYIVRTSAKGLSAGCLWGTSKDLAFVLGESEATFDRVERGVFQTRLTTTVGFDPRASRFTDEESLSALFERAGVGDVAVVRRTLAGAPALVVSGRGPNGAPLRLLYLALIRPAAEAEAAAADVLLVNFHAAVSADPADESTWKRFLESVRAAR